MRLHLRRITALLGVAVTGVAVVSALSTGVAEAGSTDSSTGLFHALAPTRVLDTRIGQGGPATVGAHGILTLALAGTNGIPASPAATVVLTVTVTKPGSAGFLTVFPGATTVPTASSLNFARAQTVSNEVIVEVGTDGKVDFYNRSVGTVQLVADLSGYFDGGVQYNNPLGSFLPHSPVRLLDTRSGLGAAEQPIRGGATLRVPLVNRAGISTGTTVVALNVTVTAPQAPGYLSVFASGTARPVASSLNFTSGQTVPNLVLAPVGADGSISIFNGSAGSSQVVADLVGFFVRGTASDAGAFVGTSPTRLLDTRTGNGAPRIAVGAHSSVTVAVAGRSGIPAGVAAAAFLNVTVTTPKGAGYLTVYPAGTPRPVASSINFSAGQTIANQVVVPVGAADSVTLYNGSSGTVDLIADASGYIRSRPGEWTMGQQIDPLSGNLDGVSCVSATFCVAVDAEGNAVQFDGTTWSAPTKITSAGGLTVSCVSSTFCMALDGAGATIRFDGTTWTRTTNTELFQGSVICRSTTFCLVAANNTETTFDGTRWVSGSIHDQSVPADVRAVSCSDAVHCVGVQGDGSAITYDGTTWSDPVPALPDSASLISCPTSTMCAAGHGHSISVLSDGHWGPSITVDPQELMSLSCASPTDCVAADRNGFQTTFDGTSWSAPALLDANGSPDPVSCAASGFCVAVDAYGRGVVRENGTWSAPATIEQRHGSLEDVSCTSAVFCAAVDHNGAALIYGASGWSAPRSIDPHLQLAAVSCASPMFCLAVGIRDEVQTGGGGGAVLRWDGTRWFDIATPGASWAPFDVSCVSPTFCMETDSDGGYSRFDGTSWSTTSPVHDPNGSSAYWISCGSPTLCLTSNIYSSDVYRYDGRTWSAGTTPFGYQLGLNPIDCRSSTFCSTVIGGSLMSYNGSTWVLEHKRTSSYEPFHSVVSCASRAFCGAISISAMPEIYDGRDWLQQPSVGTAISCPVTGFCMTVGDSSAAWWS